MPAGKSPAELVKGLYAGMTREQKAAIAQTDCGLVAMQLMQAARVHGYDTCPLGAYDQAQVSRVLAMDEARYLPIMLLTIGKAAQAGSPPYRLPVSQVASFVG